jgi:hypothetical protein
MRSTLIVAHPAHELSVLGWVFANQPIVHVLTDGSGRQGSSRLHRTREIVNQTGSTCGGVFGQLSDRSLYQRTLDVDVDYFERLTQQLATSLIQDEIELVVGDAEEGDVMAHDLWRGIRLAAICRAEQALGREIKHWEFNLSKGDGTDRLPVECIRLNDDPFHRKMTIARQYDEVRPFVEKAIEEFGWESHRVEKLYLVDRDRPIHVHQNGMTKYELHGLSEVQKGTYRAAIRFQEHLAPIFAHVGAPLMNDISGVAQAAR